MSIVQEITWSPLPAGQFFAEETKKEMIFVHHTASSPSPYGVLAWWASNAERVGTSFIISGKPQAGNSRYKDGEIVQAFSSKHWGYHLGLKKAHLVQGGKTSEWLNKHSIGIEICNWGQLTLRNGRFCTYAHTEARPSVVAESDVLELDAPYRGFKYYQRYTDAQIEQTRKLLLYLGQTWDIPTKYAGDEIFNIDRRALMGIPSIYTHTSVRPDKNDCFPQKELIQMLASF